MVWVRLDDKFFDHPKLAGIGDPAPLAGWQLVCILGYCNRYLTDGHIPIKKAHAVVSWNHIGLELGGVPGMVTTGEDMDGEWACLLLAEAGFLDECYDHRDCYLVHDYLDYQPSKADVEGVRTTRQEQASDAGKKSAEARKAKYGTARPGGATTNENANVANEATNDRSQTVHEPVHERSGTSHERLVNPVPVPGSSVLKLVSPRTVSNARETEQAVDPFETPRDVAALVAAVRQHRPDWNEKGVRTAIREAQARAITWRQAAAAVIAVASDPESKTPGRIKSEVGYWWQQLSPDDTRPASALIAAFAAKAGAA